MCLLNNLCNLFGLPYPLVGSRIWPSDLPPPIFHSFSQGAMKYNNSPDFINNLPLNPAWEASTMGSCTKVVHHGSYTNKPHFFWLTL